MYEWVLCSLFLIYLLLVGWCVLLYRNSCNFRTDYTPSCALPDKVTFDKEGQILGSKHLKESSVVVCGLARDSVNSLKSSIPMMKNLLKHFGEYKVLIVENDSTDNTRPILLDWSESDPSVIVLGCGVNAPECKLSKPKTMGHEISFSRIEKMAQLRNVYVDFIKDNLSHYDYMLVFDFDIVGNVFLDGLWDTFHLLSIHPEISGITANGVLNIPIVGPYYYDAFAVFSTDSPSCFSDHVEKQKDEQRMRDEGKVPSTLSGKFQFRPDFGLIQVKSAFAGLGIYRVPRIIETDASYTLNCDKITCEHTALSEGLGSVFINSKMVLYATQH